MKKEQKNEFNLMLDLQNITQSLEIIRKTPEINAWSKEDKEQVLQALVNLTAWFNEFHKTLKMIFKSGLVDLDTSRFIKQIVDSWEHFLTLNQLKQETTDNKFVEKLYKHKEALNEIIKAIKDDSKKWVASHKSEINNLESEAKQAEKSAKKTQEKKEQKEQKEKKKTKKEWKEVKEVKKEEQTKEEEKTDTNNDTNSSTTPEENKSDSTTSTSSSFVDSLFDLGD